MNFLLNLLILLNMGCDSENTESVTNESAAGFANVVSVSTSGSEDSYNFSVGIESPDTGCKQYADWWEVITEDGELIYRRILAHSHTNEQPFVRSGGKVTIKKDQTVIVRAHMNNSGYGGIAYSGSVEGGFERMDLDADFAEDLETVSPQPSGCAF